MASAKTSSASSKGRGTGTAPVRRSRKRRLRRTLERLSDTWNRLLETSGLWLALFLLIGTWSLIPGGLFFSPHVEPGSIAPRDYLAARALLLPDEESTQEKRQRARLDVLPVYDLDSRLLDETDSRLASVFAGGRQILDTAPPPVERPAGLAGDVAVALGEATALQIDDAQAEVMIRKSFSGELEDRIRSLVRQALYQGVVGNKALLLEHRMRGVTLRDLATGREGVDFNLDRLGYPDQLRGFLEAEVRDWPDLTAAERASLVDFLVANIPPNLRLNQSETETRREAAAAAVDPVVVPIRKGQVVVRKGDEIDANAARAILELRGRREWPRLSLLLVGTLGLLSLASLVLWLGIRREQVADHSPRRLISEALILLLASILGAKFSLLVAEALPAAFTRPPLSSFESYVYAVPFASLALVATLLAGRNVALVLSLVFSILISRLAGSDALEMVIYSVAGSLAAVFAVERFQLKQRLAMTRIGLMVGAANVVTILLLVALRGEVERGPGQIGFDLLCGFAGGLLAAAAAGFTLPILETVLSITTDIKLIELANTNLPLLRRLAFEAPGTFQHSLMVANLAKEACEVVGADPVLAYTGALYHDVGKVLRPDYFIENQRTGINPHDKLQPSMSVLILISHIKDGMDLAREHHLPRPIREAIEQHHGNRLINFFYNRAQEQAKAEGREVREEKYRYPGPRPRNKVMGVLMLADGVEAASRTLVDPTPLKIRTLIRTIVDDCLADGQLDHTDLTLSDLKQIREAFLRVLSNIFHQRVDYPGFDFNAEPKPRRLPAAKAS